MSEDGRPAAQNGALDIRIKDAVRGLDDGGTPGMLEQDELCFRNARHSVMANFTLALRRLQEFQ